jgi:hypothetical protein
MFVSSTFYYDPPSLGVVSDYVNAFSDLRFAEYKISKIKLPKQSIQIKDLMTPWRSQNLRQAKATVLLKKWVKKLNFGL